MKKYIKPDLAIFRIETQKMIAESLGVNENPSGGEGNPSTSLSRGGRDFFDE